MHDATYCRNWVPGTKGWRLIFIVESAVEGWYAAGGVRDGKSDVIVNLCYGPWELRS